MSADDRLDPTFDDLLDALRGSQSADPTEAATAAAALEGLAHLLPAKRRPRCAAGPAVRLGLLCGWAC
jgi:hypothetical protein